MKKSAIIIIVCAAAALMLIIPLCIFLFHKAGNGPDPTVTTGSEGTTGAIQWDNKPDEKPSKAEDGGLPSGCVLSDAAEKAKYYCPDIFDQTAVPCRINIETGETQYACPSENCNHSGKECFYYNKWVTSVNDTGTYLFMTALVYPKGTYYIYAYEWSTGKMYSFHGGYIGQIHSLIHGVGNGKIYGFYNQNDSYRIICFDPVKAAGTKIASSSDGFYPLYCDDGGIYGITKNGLVTVSPPEYVLKEYKAPDGCEGFELRKPGMLYKTDSPAAVYDVESRKMIAPDMKLDITSPVRGGDYYYYQSRGKVENGKDADGKEVKYVRYNNDIYRQGLDGEAEKFTVSTDYRFIIYAASGDYVIGRLMYKLSDGIYTPFEELGYDHVRINIVSGEVQLLTLYTEHGYFLDETAKE